MNAGTSLQVQGQDVHLRELADSLDSFTGRLFVRQTGLTGDLQLLIYVQYMRRLMPSRNNNGLTGIVRVLPIHQTILRSTVQQCPP